MYKSKAGDINLSQDKREYRVPGLEEAYRDDETRGMGYPSEIQDMRPEPLDMLFK